MDVSHLLQTTEHRPWEIPKEPWKFYQEWNNAIFLHWEVELSELKTFVPEELEIDLFESKPWVSVVAFTMENIRPKYFPSLPPISNFDEINIRTYVKSNNKTGVYFLSIEGGKYLSCKIAKSISELPYRFSKMKRTHNQYKSHNTKLNDSINIEFAVGKELKEKTVLNTWLTERYALFQDTDTSINEFEIHHLEWPLNAIGIETMDLNYPRFDELIRGNPSIAHYSKGVKVVSWGRKRRNKSSYKKAPNK